MAAQALRVEGYREFMRACARADKETKQYVRETFRKVGEGVRLDAAARFGRYDARSAAGFRVVVRQRGVSVEQRLGRTTGRRRDFGDLQLRKALWPALDSGEERTVREMEKALDTVGDHFERR